MLSEKQMRGSKLIVLTIICAFIVICMGAQNSYAVSKLRIRVKMPDKARPTVIKCSWKSELKGIRYYKLTCTQVNDNNDKKIKTVYAKKIKKASGTVTFRTLKKDKLYDVQISAYDNSGYVRKSNGRLIHTGLPAPQADTWEHTSASGDRLNVAFYCGARWDSYSPDTMYLYRKSGNSSWKKIKTFTITKNDTLYQYTDKDVKAGKTYKYRTRCKDRIKVNGKKKTIYSPYSRMITLTAMNQRGILSCRFSDSTPQQAEMPVIDIDITMDKYNWKTELDFDNTNKWAPVDNFVCEPAETIYDLVGFKLENGDWQEATGKVALEAGHSISLRFKLRENQPMIDFTKNRRVALYIVRYKEESGYMMTMWPASGKGSIYYEEEEWG